MSTGPDSNDPTRPITTLFSQEFIRNYVHWVFGLCPTIVTLQLCLEPLFTAATFSVFRQNCTVGGAKHEIVHCTYGKKHC